MSIDIPEDELEADDDEEILRPAPDTAPDADVLSRDDVGVSTILFGTFSHVAALLLPLLDSAFIESLESLESLGSPLESLRSPLESLGSPLESLGSPLESLGSPLESLGSPRESLESPPLRFKLTESVLLWSELAWSLEALFGLRLFLPGKRVDQKKLL